MRTILAISFCLIVSACIDPLDVQTSQAIRTLVVAGYITTEYGPHKIELSTSAKYGSIFEDFSKPIEGAIVSIRDDDGLEHFLEETEAGIYLTNPLFKADIGRTYSLRVVVSDEERYISTPQKVAATAGIDSLYALYKSRPTENDLITDHTVEIYASATTDNADAFYIWKNVGTYLIETSPEKHVTVDFFGNTIADPKSCCNICWVDETGDNDVHITTAEELKTTNLHLAAVIIDDGARFDDKYLMRIEQLSISRDAYQFFNNLKLQLSVEGNIFDPPPATVGSNMINIDNPNMPVIGYFYASDIKRDSIFIEQSILPARAKNLDYFDDCRTLARSTDIRPKYWY